MYPFLQLRDHIEILQQKFESFVQKGGERFWILDRGLVKRKRQNFVKLKETKRGEGVDQDFLEKSEAATYLGGHCVT